ncbi:HAD family hydrolase [Amycolatopsis tolypomycina]|uniref:HAD family hydrolase n=1 Tax=Amycolatopsis tolypomycina TaxID=208445 RepID=UPI0033A1C1AB
MANDSLREALSSARLILFDFDGPICDVFAGLPAADVARRLERHLASKVQTDDPLRILQEAVKYGSETVRAVEDELIDAELQAVEQSIATAGGLEAMGAAAEQGKSVGVLSNNSADAVARFLEKVGFLPNVAPLVGRVYGRPDLMKPNPHTFRAALDAAGRDASATVFIGDSTTDIEVAHAVGAPVVGYANKPGKAAAFATAGATIIVDDMRTIHTALISQRH